MIIVGNAVLSDDFKENDFVCNLTKCKGACCVEGDMGAPLEIDEKEKLEKIYRDVAPYLSKKGKDALKKQGAYVIDQDGDYVTPIIPGTEECAYAYYNENNVLKCGIEKAWEDGKIDFQKPISCHLYPARITQYDQYEAVNYDRWEICSPACELGKELQVPLYKFLKHAFVRKYGQAWYDELVEQIEGEKEVSSSGNKSPGE